MSRQTQQDLQVEINESQAKTKELQAALRTVQEANKLPLAYISHRHGEGRLVVRITPQIRSDVNCFEDDYIILCPDGTTALVHPTEENTKKEYKVEEVIFK